jgi:hypothetical protein
MALIFKAVLVKGGRVVEDAGRLRKVRRRERRVGDVIFVSLTWRNLEVAGGFGFEVG